MWENRVVDLQLQLDDMQVKFGRLPPSRGRKDGYAKETTLKERVATRREIRHARSRLKARQSENERKSQRYIEREALRQEKGSLTNMAGVWQRSLRTPSPPSNRNKNRNEIEIQAEKGLFSEYEPSFFMNREGAVIESRTRVLSRSESASPRRRRRSWSGPERTSDILEDGKSHLVSVSQKAPRSNPNPNRVSAMLRENLGVFDEYREKQPEGEGARGSGLNQNAPSHSKRYEFEDLIGNSGSVITRKDWEGVFGLQGGVVQCRSVSSPWTASSTRGAVTDMIRDEVKETTGGMWDYIRELQLELAESNKMATRVRIAEEAVMECTDSIIPELHKALTGAQEELILAERKQKKLKNDGERAVKQAMTKITELSMQEVPGLKDQIQTERTEFMERTKKWLNTIAELEERLLEADAWKITASTYLEEINVLEELRIQQEFKLNVTSEERDTAYTELGALQHSANVAMQSAGLRIIHSVAVRMKSAEVAIVISSWKTQLLVNKLDVQRSVDTQEEVEENKRRMMGSFKKYQMHLLDRIRTKLSPHSLIVVVGVWKEKVFEKDSMIKRDSKQQANNEATWMRSALSYAVLTWTARFTLSLKSNKSVLRKTVKVWCQVHLSRHLIEWKEGCKSDYRKTLDSCKSESQEINAKYAALQTKFEYALKKNAIKLMLMLNSTKDIKEVLVYVRGWARRKNAALKALAQDATVEASGTQEVTQWLLQEYKSLLQRHGEESAVPLELFEQLTAGS